jgi:hypothetical protein
MTACTTGETLENGAKIAAHYNRRLIELQKKYAHDLLTHYNPYTKTRYVDEPTIAMMEIINESTLFWVGGYSALPPSYIQEINDLFTKWCNQKGISRPQGSVPDLLRQKTPPWVGSCMRCRRRPSRRFTTTCAPLG